jgi:filamentous hemagglutinin family protein
LTQKIRGNQEGRRRRGPLATTVLHPPAATPQADAAAKAHRQSEPQKEHPMTKDLARQSELKPMALCTPCQGIQRNWRKAPGHAELVQRGNRKEERDTGTVTVTRYVCDRCGTAWEYENDKNDQQAGWSLLNRVNDPSARPSQILGRIQGQGTVMLVNRNGVVFDGGSQVNVKNLAAAAVNISDAQFRKGLYSDAQGSGFIPTFGNEVTTTASSFSLSSLVKAAS